MSASEGMYDVVLKPKLLRSLLREYVPEENHPFGNPSELTYIVSTIKTHKLLAEWAPQPLDQALSDAWKSAVDSWIHRLRALASSNSPDKSWAGICLLGFTCQECSSARFLSSYADWLNKLLSTIQEAATVPHFVKAASCASLSDMFTRLSGFSNAKKDATSHAARVVLLVAKLLTEDSSACVLEEAMHLICTMINFFPLSVQRHYECVEVAIASKLLSGDCNPSVLKKLSYGLSMLPKSKGDEASWCLAMDKILLCLNSQLTDAFQGIEEEARSTEMMRALIPSGKEQPAPLGGLAFSERTSDLSTRRPERVLGSRISTLLQCCCNMLTNPYPVMVPVPVHGLISLAERVLLVDGSFLPSSYAFMTTLKQEFICSEIPLLQLYSLEILTSVVKGLSSQILPHVAAVVDLLNEYLRRCKLPDLRKKTYSILKILLSSMGVGIAIHLSQDIVNNVLLDLDFHVGEKDGKSPGLPAKVHTELLSDHPHLKKRKHSSMKVISSQEQLADDGPDVEMRRNSTPLSLKIAALEALEALLIAGGSMRSESWRGTVDRLLIEVATNACKEGWSNEEREWFRPGDPPAPIWADFQLAALHALLASLLSPGRVRPPHLALGIQIFRRGMQQPGTKLGEYCGHALLALEVLIHPRGLPMTDQHYSPDDHYVVSHKLRDGQGSASQAGMLGKGASEPESEDDLIENWLDNDDEPESVDERPSPKRASITHLPEKNEMMVSVTAPIDNPTDGDRVCMLESPKLPVDVPLGPQSSTQALETIQSVPPSTGVGSAENTTIPMNDSVSEVNEELPSSTSEHDLEMEDNRADAIVKRISDTLLRMDRSEGNMVESDDELSDAIPDIVVGDPDSD